MPKFLSEQRTIKSTMVYIKRDGTIVKRTPITIFGFFWAIVNFIYLLFRTLFDPNYNLRSDKYLKHFSPSGSSGPPKPPPPKFGGFGPSGDGPSPPSMGGCGCG